MSYPERDRVEHFRQRWAEEYFSDKTRIPSSSSKDDTGDQYLTEVAAPGPATPKSPARGIYGPLSRSARSWRGSFGIGSRSHSRSQTRSQENLTEVGAPKRYTFQPQNADEETALPTIPDSEPSAESPLPSPRTPPTWLTELYTVSWLIFFSLLGTLSRLGVEAITEYPNAPVTSRVLWANLGGSFFMGFLSEDKTLFQRPRPEHQKETPSEENVAEYKKWKKTIPLFIGLSTGYCGSFTSFSSFLRDAFLEITNALDGPSPTQPYQSASSIAPRNGGFSFLAVVAILVLHPAVSIAALQVGAQFALLTAPILPNIPRTLVDRFLNPLAVFVGFGSWLVASLVLAIIPPYNTIEWRTRAMFPLLFSPVGCLLRYYLSKHLNPLNPKFPMGTFASNIFGTIIIGLSWDLQHADLANLGVHSANACAILVGVEEGFCGCLTTVSTWVVELTTLSRRFGWIYGSVSVAVGVSSLVLIMGGMGWTIGFGTPICG